MTTNLVLLPARHRRPLGDPDPAEIITVTFGGDTFRCGRRTYAHLLATQAKLDRVRPGARIIVLQPCYNAGVELSKGTHDGDGVLDVAIIGWDYWDAEQRFLRDMGWLDWWRHTGAWASPSKWHHHMISLGCPGPVGEFVPGQVADGYNHTFGLKNQHNVDLDKSWWPGDEGPPPWPVGTPAQWAAALDATVFDYPAWVREQEAEMGWDDWTEGEQDRAAKKIAGEVVKQWFGAFVDDGKTTARAALRKGALSLAAVRQLGARSRPSVNIDVDDQDGP